MIGIARSPTRNTTALRSVVLGCSCLVLLAMAHPRPCLAGNAPPAAGLAAPGPERGRYAEAELVLRLKPGRRFIQAPPGRVRTGSASLDEKLARATAFAAEAIFPLHGADRRLHASLGMDRIYRVRLRRPADIPALAAEMARHPDVEWAEPDYGGTAADALPVIPDDPAFVRQWGFRNLGSVPGLGPSTAGADIKATEAWSVTTGDSGVVVGVLDSGLRYDYPEFAGRVWINADEIPGNGVDDDENGYVDDVRGYNFASGNGEVLDDLGHGTAVSGIIAAATNNGLGYAGLDWHARIMPLKVLNSQGFGFYTWWASGIYYAVNHGVRVLNMSLVGLEPSLTLQTAIQYAYAHGCFIAGAMGNSGSNVRFIPAYYENEVVAVGATDLNDRRAFFSTYGDHIDVVAPGQDIAVLTLGNDDFTAYGSGTSFATPMVSGLAALLLAKDPSLGAGALRDIICATADDQVGGPREDTPGFDPYHGYGRINCYRALTLDRIPHAPTVAAPAWVDAFEQQPLQIAVTASDPDGDPILRLDADLSVLPRGNDAVFTASADHSSGTLDWTPQLNDAGVYTMTFRAYDPLRGAASTHLVVSNTNQPPTVAAPSVFAMVETEGAQFDIQAEDPDLEDLTLTAEGVPNGARFADNGNNTGTFVWEPEAGQAGSYHVVFAATDALGEMGTAATRVDVSPVDRPPVISAPESAHGAEGILLSFEITAADPDGDPIGSLSADLSWLPSGNDAAFAVAGDHGSFSWTPGFSHSGLYPVFFSADNAATASHKTMLAIDDVDRPPVVSAPAQVSGAENVRLEAAVGAADPDGDVVLSLEAAPLPTGATFEVGAGNGSGTLRWTPDFGQAGTYEVRIAATSPQRPRSVSGAVLEGEATVRFEIANVNRAPAARAGGPYAGVEGAPIAFDGSGSGDPDGDPLRYAWSFGDGGAAVGSAPTHAYDVDGEYRVLLVVADGSLSGTDSTIARIAGALPARAFLAGRRTLSLSGASSGACVYLEPLDGSYANADIDRATLALVSEGTGSVSTITPVLRNLVEGDRDRNGVPDLSLCFTREDLRRLFAGVTGRTVVAASVDGRVIGGAKIHADISLTITGTGAAVSAWPNPLAAGGTITVRSGRDGPVRVRLFDVRGRLVRTLLDQPGAVAGYHDAPLDGTGAAGVPSGVYFIRAETPEGMTTTRIAILK